MGYAWRTPSRADVSGQCDHLLMIKSEHSIDHIRVEVGAVWHRPSKPIAYTIETKCVGIQPDVFEAVLSVAGKPVYRSARHKDVAPAERDAEAWLADRLVAVLAPDGVRETGPGFYDTEGRWNATSEDW